MTARSFWNQRIRAVIDRPYSGEAPFKCEVAVDAAGKIRLPASKKGTNVLNLTIEGAQAGDDIQLMEDCGDGKSSFLKKKRAGAAPGGADPVMGFRIHASSV